GRSGMIWIGCPHNRSLSPNRWESGGDFCTGLSDCKGWSARIHLHTGRLVYAETPTMVGLEALTKCLSLTKGTLRVHEVYMAPRRANLEGTAQQLLIRAAALADEMGRGRSDLAAELLDDPVETIDLPDPVGPPAIAEGLAVPEILTTPPAPAASGAAAMPTSSPEVPASVVTERSVTGSRFGPEADHSLDLRALEAPPAMPSKPTTDRLRALAAEDTTGLGRFLGGEAGVRLVADTGAGGQVMAVTGQGDAESAAAVAALCISAFGVASEQLGLGAVEKWCLVGPSNALYAAHQDDDKVRLALGSASDNAFSILGRLFDEEES
ncbi:MAG: DUF4388 domain-containing protein, partial [Myxococcota bacterium]